MVCTESREASSRWNNCLLVVSIALGHIRRCDFSWVVSSFGVGNLIPETNRPGGKRFCYCHSFGADHRKLPDDQPWHHRRVSGEDLRRSKRPAALPSERIDQTQEWH